MQTQMTFETHGPAITNAAHDVDPALKRKNKLALMECIALIVLLMLAMFWPLL
jgi:hypothetical protein